MSGLVYLAQIYAQLNDAAQLEMREGELNAFPRSSKRIVEFLSGYALHD